MSASVKPREPIEYHPVMVALGKARAAWWLIDAFEHGYVEVSYAGLGERAKHADECERIRDRVYHGALDDLEEALAEAETAFREALTGAARVMEIKNDGEA